MLFKVFLSKRCRGTAAWTSLIDIEGGLKLVCETRSRYSGEEENHLLEGGGAGLTLESILVKEEGGREVSELKEEKPKPG